nr:hypothetical protein 24 [bacterium]
MMKPTISIALTILGLTFPAPALADEATLDLADLPPLPPEPTASIQQGDSLASFLRRHGINKEELKTLNPGLALTELTVGQELQIRRGSPGTFEPSDSPPAPTPERQYVINQLERNRRQEALRWRSFGGKQYDWKGWKRSANGTHTTTVRYGSSTYRTYKVAVTCAGLKVSHGYENTWTEWKMPDEGEEQMLIELCSQIPGAPKANVRLAPPPLKVCTGSRIACSSKL